MHSHTRLRFGTATAVTASLALTLALSACSTPPTPSPEPTSSGTSSTSGSPTSAPPPTSSAAPTASTPPAPDTAYQPATPTSPAKNVPKPVMPALAKEKSEAGQKAFIKYWLETYNYAFDSGDVGPLRAASASDCDYCSKAVKGVDVLRKQNATWRVGGGVTAALGQASFHTASDGLIRVRVRVTDAPVRFYTSEGTSTQYKAAGLGESTRDFWIERKANSWSIVEVY